MPTLPSRWTHRAKICYVVYYCVVDVITVCEHVNLKRFTALIGARRAHAVMVNFFSFFSVYTILHSYTVLRSSRAMSINIIIEYLWLPADIVKCSRSVSKKYGMSEQNLVNGAINMYFLIKQWVINFQYMNSSQKPALINSSIWRIFFNLLSDCICKLFLKKLLHTFSYLNTTLYIFSL